MSQRPAHAFPLSLVSSNPATPQEKAVADADPAATQPRPLRERAPRALGAQAGQWRWLSARASHGGLR